MHQLKPTVHIDAVPELARQRERFREGGRGRKHTAAGEAGASDGDAGASA